MVSLKRDSASKLIQNLIKTKSSTRWIKIMTIPIPPESDDDIRKTFKIAKALSSASPLLQGQFDAGHLSRFTRAYITDILRVLGQKQFCKLFNYVSNCESVMEQEVFESFEDLCKLG